MKKRLFFGYEVHAPWPMEYPKGRVIDSASRHMTLAFLGDILYHPLEKVLPHFPKPDFKIGPTGYFDGVLFLPTQHPNVVAWHADLNKKEICAEYHEDVVMWLVNKGVNVDKRPNLPHVTLARTPLDAGRWQTDFTPLPMITTAINLYESVGNLVYQPIWSYPLTLPFEELDHTADIAFMIKGETMEELHHHAQIALAFKFPPFIDYAKKIPLANTIEEIIISLNTLVTSADSDIGCPIKAVTFHGDVAQEEELFKWEMIIDV